MFFKEVVKVSLFLDHPSVYGSNFCQLRMSKVIFYAVFVTVLYKKVIQLVPVAVSKSFPRVYWPFWLFEPGIHDAKLISSTEFNQKLASLISGS